MASRWITKLWLGPQLQRTPPMEASQLNYYWLLTIQVLSQRTHCTKPSLFSSSACKTHGRTPYNGCSYITQVPPPPSKHVALKQQSISLDKPQRDTSSGSLETTTLHQTKFTATFKRKSLLIPMQSIHLAGFYPHIHDRLYHNPNPGNPRPTRNYPPNPLQGFSFYLDRTPNSAYHHLFHLSSHHSNSILW